MLLVASSMHDYAEQTQQFLIEGDIKAALKAARNVSALRTSQVLTRVPLENVIAFLLQSGWEKAAYVAGYLPPAFTVTLLGQMSEDDAGSLLAEMAPEKFADVLKLLPEAYASRLLDQMDPVYRQRVMQLAEYPEGTAGSVMSPNFLTVDADSHISEVIEAVRLAPAEVERTAYVFVLHPETQRLEGVVSLRELMLGDPKAKVRNVMTSDVFAIAVDEPALEAARRIRSRRLKMMPVVDEQQAMVGIISIGQSMDLLAHELADEFVAMNAASPDESFYTPPRQAVKKRLPWMAANIFLNLGAVAVISSFENTIVQVAILAAFLPMITDMGGNVGIQALSVSIRSIALGEARLIDFWKAVRKELVIGLFNGVALGALFCVVAYVLQGNVILGVVAGIALGINVLVAGVVGGTMPFLIKRMGKDPALMTGPILTTITDITGVTIYLGLATLFLSSLMVG
ncbi:magnesium transporter [Methylophaga lonarensis MPL]|uniref:Magnesium transporter MgtE n=1 Tax=Methylophaga lonarensis MPL TaxID=1286106 RepID=M7P413_9GAMM|nr:magnesium transporter [Methylophaga lonarensis]EMR14246.1 magnesium transporter [Methylophaga lonarensis MPL]